jgi:hypothetical protein
MWAVSKTTVFAHSKPVLVKFVFGKPTFNDPIDDKLYPFRDNHGLYGDGGTVSAKRLVAVDFLPPYQALPGVGADIGPDNYAASSVVRSRFGIAGFPNAWESLA